MNNLKKFIFIFIFFFIFLIPVNAELDTQYSITMLGRDYTSLPFTTGYGSDEVSYYTNNLRIYGTNTNLTNLPRYLYFIYCANADYNIITTDVYQGGITHQGATKGGTCQMYLNNTYYDGYYYLDRWTITNWADYSSSGIYEYGIQWRVYPDNTASYYSIFRGESLFLSNELITDFTSDYILQSLINSNGTIINSINNSINSSTGSINSNINQKSQDIIDNQNRTSGSIIQNQNENTNKQIDSEKVCSSIDKNNIVTDNKYLNNNGSLVSLNQTGVTGYIKINSNSELKTLSNFSGGSSLAYCFYNTNKEIISCSLEQTLQINSLINIPSNASYVRFSIIKSTNQPTFSLCNNGNQALHDSLNDDTLDNSSINNTFDTLETLEGTSITPLTDFVTIPLTWVQSLLTPSEACQTINLPLPFLNNKTLDLPCMNNFWDRMGVLATLVQLVWVAVVCVRVFNGLFLLVCDVKDPNPDKDMTKLRTWEL